MSVESNFSAHAAGDSRRFCAVAYFMLAALVLPVLVGCRPLHGTTSIELLPVAPLDKSSEPDSATTGNTPPTAKSTPINLAALQNVQWVQRQSAGQWHRGEPRWTNSLVGQVWLDATVNRPALVELTANEDRSIATNAAICLARLSDTQGISRLIDSAGNAQLPAKLRLAAIDALGQFDDQPAINGLQKLFDHHVTEALQVDTKANNLAPQYFPELHVELLYALANHSTIEDPRLTPPNQSLATGVKLATLEIWQANESQQGVPATIVAWRQDADSRIRTETIRLLSERRAPESLQAAQDALNDSDMEVRLTAIRALGKLDSDEARKLLRPLAIHHGELIRAAALGSLINLGEPNMLAAAARDKSSHVRAVAVEALAAQPSDDFAAIAQTLIVDRSHDLQRRTIESLAAWPDELAIPVLFIALEKGGQSVQSVSHEQLVKRWPEASAYDPQLPQKQKAEALAALRVKWEQSRNVAPSSLANSTNPTLSPQWSPAQARRAAELVKQLPHGVPANDRDRATIDELVKLGPPLVTWLEATQQAQHNVWPAAIYERVLPPLAPEFLTLVDFTSAEVATRRRGADRLAVRSLETLLRPLALERLATLMELETDELVWQATLRAIAKCDDATSARIAASGLGHRAAEVRRLACEHFSEHAEFADEALLAPALDDSQASVVRAAVRAWGRSQRVTTTEPLRTRLSADDHRVRVEAAIALCRLEDEYGPPALQRFVYDADPEIGRLAVISMGELHDETFIPTLVQLLDQGQGVGQTAAASLRQIVGDEVAEQVLVDTTSSVERAAAWRKWWSEQR